MFGYNINSNEFSEKKIVTESDCICQPIQYKVEYFPETEEFLVSFKAVYHNDLNGPFNHYLGALSSDFEFTNYAKKENLIPSECKEVNLFNIIYSSNTQTYSLLIDSPQCLEQKKLILEILIHTLKMRYVVVIILLIIQFVKNIFH